MLMLRKIYKRVDHLDKRLDSLEWLGSSAVFPLPFFLTFTFWTEVLSFSTLKSNKNAIKASFLGSIWMISIRLCSRHFVNGIWLLVAQSVFFKARVHRFQRSLPIQVHSIWKTCEMHRFPISFSEFGGFNGCNIHEIC